MNTKQIKLDNIMLSRLYNAYIQSYIINSFTSSLVYFLEREQNNDPAYNDDQGIFALPKISGTLSCQREDGQSKGFTQQYSCQKSKKLTKQKNKKNIFVSSQICGLKKGRVINMENKQFKPNNIKADNIDINKTAVAITYDPADAAPKVIASGKGYLADKIIQKAKETDIPLHKDDRLVNTLSKIEIGEMIPPQLYDVVAEILVFVDKMDRIKEKVYSNE